MGHILRLSILAILFLIVTCASSAITEESDETLLGVSDETKQISHEHIGERRDDIFRRADIRRTSGVLDEKRDGVRNETRMSASKQNQRKTLIPMDNGMILDMDDGRSNDDASLQAVMEEAPVFPDLEERGVFPIESAPLVDEREEGRYIPEPSFEEMHFISRRSKYPHHRHNVRGSNRAFIARRNKKKLANQDAWLTSRDSFSTNQRPDAMTTGENSQDLLKDSSLGGSPLNLANADLVDIPDRPAGSSAKEIPSRLMESLNPMEYAPNQNVQGHWVGYKHQHHGHSLHPCHHRPCLNGGRCQFLHTDKNQFRCNCKKGFSGHYCERVGSSCHPNPCKHGGQCTRTLDSYFCTCRPGYKGHNCEVAGECLSNPCQNSGVCVELSASFTCQCGKGVEGRFCENKLGGCGTKPCKNGGLCTELGDGKYECACPAGFTCLDCSCTESIATTPSTSILPEQCQCMNGGTCVATKTGSSCNCPLGFHGNYCAVADLCTPNPCDNGGICVQDGEENYKCICPYGYKGSDCQMPLACVSHPCGNGATCSETTDGYTCKCAVGYKGRQCQDLNPCSKNPCQHKSICIEKGSLYSCQCRNGYRGKTCHERDPCSPSPCGTNGLCTERNGVVACNCTRGWMGDHCDTADLCQTNRCLNGATCVHTIDEFKCMCPPGYHGDRCERRRACHSDPCMNGGVCEEVGLTFVCRCAPGYHGARCKSLSHCEPNPCHNQGKCFQGEEGYICECPNGFIGKFCEEQDFCTSNPCMNGGRCLEENGSFRCKCREGYFGHLCQENVCDRNPCLNGGSCTTSSNTNGFSCECPSPFHGTYCADNDPCEPHPCHNGGSCHLPIFSTQQGDPNESVVSIVGPNNNTNIRHDTLSGVDGRHDTLSGVDVNHYHLRADPAFFLEDSHSRVGDVARFSDDTEDHPEESRYHHDHLIDGYDDQINKRTLANLTKPRRVKRYDTSRNPAIEERLSMHRKDAQVNEGARVPRVVVSLRSRSTGVLLKRTLHELYVCKCTPGYLGAHCQHMNPCRDYPCRNGGSCLPEGDRYLCQCVHGYGGLNCDDAHPCSPNPCLNNGKCLLGKNVHGYSCQCDHGWKGYNCEFRDRCALHNTCLHGGECVSLQYEIKCKCRPRFSGTLCEVDKCKNCHANAFCRHGHCVCKPGFYGNGFQCDSMGDPCQPNPCDNDATCRSGQDGKIFTCHCKPGFLGTRCEYTNPCAHSPCQNEGLCVDATIHSVTTGKLNDYKCYCTSDYKGRFCEEKRLMACRSSPCLNNGTCFDGSSQTHSLAHPHDYECFCAKGFAGKNCQLERYPCELHPCVNGGTCFDASSLADASFDAHGYKCSCPHPYADPNCRVSTDEPGPCTFDPCMNSGRCVDITNSNNERADYKETDFGHADFKCFCAPNYTGELCQEEIARVAGVIGNTNEPPTTESPATALVVVVKHMTTTSQLKHPTSSEKVLPQENRKISSTNLASIITKPGGGEIYKESPRLLRATESPLLKATKPNFLGKEPSKVQLPIISTLVNPAPTEPITLRHTGKAEGRVTLQNVRAMTGSVRTIENAATPYDTRLVNALQVVENVTEGVKPNEKSSVASEKQEAVKETLKENRNTTNTTSYQNDANTQVSESVSNQGVTMEGVSVISVSEENGGREDSATKKEVTNEVFPPPQQKQSLSNVRDDVKESEGVKKSQGVKYDEIWRNFLDSMSQWNKPKRLTL